MGRQWFTLTSAPRTSAGTASRKAAPGAGALPRRRARPPQAAAAGAGAGRLQPGHHDGAACRAAPRGAAGRDRRLFRPVRAAGRGRARGGRGRDQEPAAGAAGARRRGRAHPAGRRCSRARRIWRRWRCRSSGTCPPASATASTRRACAMAANSWPGDSACAAEAARQAGAARHDSRTALTFRALHNPVMLPIHCGASRRCGARPSGVVGGPALERAR